MSFVRECVQESIGRVSVDFGSEKLYGVQRRETLVKSASEKTMLTKNQMFHFVFIGSQLRVSFPRLMVGDSVYNAFQFLRFVLQTQSAENQISSCISQTATN